jgi:DNA-binding MarR family transcriptional regulator
MSADLQIALIDIALWLYRGFFVPGDQLLPLLREHAPRVTEFLLDATGHGSMLSGIISSVVWLGAIIAIVVVYRLIRDLDRALTAFVLRLHDELQRALRVVTRRLGIAFRSYALERQARLTRTEVFEQPGLSALQLEVLRSHAALPPAHLLTPNEIASALEMHSRDVEQVLATLRKLSLVERTFGAGDGEDGYRLTRAGEVLLAACNRSQPVKGAALPERTVRSKRIEPTLGRV